MERIVMRNYYRLHQGAIALLVAALLTLPRLTSANLVVDGGFEQGAVYDVFTTYNAVSSMGGWTVTAGSVDLIGTYWQPAVDSQSVDMAGFYANGTIQQTISGLVPNAWYCLTFDMSGNPDGPPVIKTLDVTFGNTSMAFTFDTTGVTHDNMRWQPRSGWFQASAASNDLIFTDASSPGTAFGAVIDNVSLVVPEPATTAAAGLLLLPLGLSGLRILRNRRLT